MSNTTAPWICTLRHDIALTGDLSGNPVDIADIANALARINRFTGHTYANWSVAQHSMLVVALAMRNQDGLTPIQARALLLHDAHEAYTGDIASPIKLALGDTWANFEQAHANHVRRALGVDAALNAHKHLVKNYDIEALRVERYRLLGRQAHRKPWPILEGNAALWTEPAAGDLDEMLHIQTSTNTRKGATEAFLQMYHQITADALNAATTASA